MPLKDREARLAYQRAYGKKHYAERRQYFLDKAKERKAQLKIWVRSIKESTPCADCGESFPHYVMDFDHVKGEKVATITALINDRRKRAIIKEMEKCELVCSNCHRERTHTRQVSGLNG